MLHVVVVSFHVVYVYNNSLDVRVRSKGRACEEVQRKAELDKAKEAEAKADAEKRRLDEEAMAARKNEVMAWLKKQGFSGVNVAKKSFFSSTYPLHKAAETGNAAMVTGLLEQGANVSQKNSAGKTAKEAWHVDEMSSICDKAMFVIKCI